MKIKNLIIALIVAVGFISCQNFTSSVSLKTTVDSVSYTMGVLDGERLILNLENAQLDSLINISIYAEAFMAAATEGELKIDPEPHKNMVQNFLIEHRDHSMKLQGDSTHSVSEFNVPSEKLDSISYILGATDGKGITGSYKRMGIDTLIKMDVYLGAYMKSVNQEEVALNGKENLPMVDNFFKKIQEERMKMEEAKLMEKYGDNKRAGEEFLAQNKALQEITETASGLQYEVLKEGKGEKPTTRSRVKVHYHGTLVDGTVFDSSVDRGEPAQFGVTQVIKGWTEGLQLMSEGAKYKFYIPYDLAYGTRDQGTIKPFSMLIFEVELLEIMN